MLAYSLAHAPGADEKPWVKFLDEEFADTGYRLRPLLRLIATSRNFFAVTAPQDPGPAESESGLANLQEG